MTGRVGSSEDAELEEEEAIDAQGAAVIVQEARARARRELEVRYPVWYATWGLTVLIIYGALWLSVRTQHPYHGLIRTGGAGAVVLLVVFFSAMLRVGLVNRAVSGVRGRVQRQWWIFRAALFAGLAALWVVSGALSHAGASRPVVGVLVAAAPMLTMGFVFFVSSAIRVDWLSLALGMWLLAVAAGGTWAGPVTILAVYALAGGGGFLAMAAIEAWLRHS